MSVQARVTFFFSSRRRHTRCGRDWSSDVCSSDLVNDANPELLIQIILQGYDARPEYGMMVGFGDMLSDEEIAAIATHERSSWGNNAPAVSAEDVKKIREYIENLNQ